MNTASETVATIETALAHAMRLLEKKPDLAALQAREILNVFPGHPQARLILGAAHRRAGDAPAALEVLEPLRGAAACGSRYLELGVARGEAGRAAQAIAALRRAVEMPPGSPDGWRLLADHLRCRGRFGGRGYGTGTLSAGRQPRIHGCARPPRRWLANNLPLADARLRAHLDAHPTDVAALRMLAEVAGRLRRYQDAEELLERCLTLAPSFDAARHNYAVVLNRAAKSAAALTLVERLLEKEPRNPGYLNLKAAILAQIGDYPRRSAFTETVLKAHPRQPKIWMSYGHALKTEGRIGRQRRGLPARDRPWSPCWARPTGALRT